MWNDLRYAIRALRRRQLFACSAVVTLGIAIGVNTAAFGIVNALMFRSSGVRDPGSLVYVYRSGGPVSGPAIFLSYPDYRDLASTNHATSDVSAYGFSRLAVAVRDEDAQSIFLELVSGNIFRTLGVGTRLGRTLDDTDDPGGPTAQPSVVISDGFWARGFNRSESALGSTLRIRGVPFTVVGVAERRFRGSCSLSRSVPERANRTARHDVSEMPIRDAPERALTSRDERSATCAQNAGTSRAVAHGSDCTSAAHRSNVA